jgi:hypothetical protein
MSSRFGLTNSNEYVYPKNDEDRDRAVQFGILRLARADPIHKIVTAAPDPGLLPRSKAVGYIDRFIEFIETLQRHATCSSA